MSEGQYTQHGVPSEACRIFDSGLAAYLEGDAQPLVVSHARECAFCGCILADLEQIYSVSTELALEEPPAWMWSRIRASLVEEGIIREPASFWQRLLSRGTWLPQAIPVGALAALLILGIGVLRTPTSLDPAHIASHRGTGGTRHVTPAPPVEDPSLAAAVTEMEKTYQERVASFNPSVKRAYQKSLESLDGEIRDLKNEGDDSQAHDYLLAAYTQKAQVLQSALEFDGR